MVFLYSVEVDKNKFTWYMDDTKLIQLRFALSCSYCIDTDIIRRLCRRTLAMFCGCRHFITVRNSSCGKAMFLHLSVSHSVHRGGWCTPPRQTLPL